MSFRSDLLWWHTFLALLNGINLTRTLAPLNFQVRFTSDASGSVGGGAIWLPRWFQYIYKWCDYPISVAAQQDELGQHYLQKTFANHACMWGMGSALAKLLSFGIVITRVQWQRSILATARCKQSCICCTACSGPTKGIRLVWAYIVIRSPAPGPFFGLRT